MINLVYHHTRLKRSLLEAIQASVLAALGDRVIQAGAKANVRISSPGSEHFEI